MSLPLRFWEAFSYRECEGFQNRWNNIEILVFLKYEQNELYHFNLVYKTATLALILKTAEFP